MTYYIFRTAQGYVISNGDTRVAEGLAGVDAATDLATRHCQDNGILPYALDYFRPAAA